MFSVVANLLTNQGTPNTHQQDQFAESMHAVYGDNTITAIDMVCSKRMLSPGKNNDVETLLGRNPTARATKAKGDMPIAGESDEYNIQLSTDSSEYMDEHFDWDTMGDARFPAMTDRAQQAVIVAKNDRQKRFFHKLWQTAQLSAISGFDPAPVLIVLGDAAYTSIELGLPLDNTGAERLFKTMVQTKTDMMNRDVVQAPNWVWFMRHSGFNPLRFGNRTSSMEFNSGADMRFGIVPYINETPIIVVPDQFWPSTSTAYTDSSFSHYNTDGRIAGSNGTPVGFLINYGTNIAPIAEVLPAGGGGIQVKALTEQHREVDTVRVKSRYAFRSLRRFAVGAVSVRSS